EPPLALVERQNYVYYHKGALAMLALRDAVGESSLNQALARFLARTTVAEPPYPTTADLLDELRSTLPEATRALLADCFEHVTLFEFKLVAPSFTDRADGTFLVHLELDARKRRANGVGGSETEIPINDWVDI